MTGSPAEHSRAGDVCRWLGLGLALAAACIRVLAVNTELPGWELDPFLIVAPIAEIGPGISILLDALILAGAGLMLLGEARAGRRIYTWHLLLAAAGAAPIVWHGWLVAGPQLNHQRVGLAWLSGFALAGAAYHACRDERFRRVVAAVLLGLIVVLALKGAQQILIEHPRTLANYRANRDAFLAAQGWTPESSMARSYERRLDQKEATGWLGLSNVYASLAAAGLVAFLPLAFAAVRRNEHRASLCYPPAAVLLTFLGLVAAGGALVAGASKGGIIAAASGVAALAVLLMLVRRATSHPGDRRTALLASLLALASVAGPLLLIMLRGRLGERLGDLSLLFRWFYMQASARIIGVYPVAGVGPDGLQPLYPLYKNPLSPEEIRSPHSILLDWSTALGVFGLAWSVLWLAWLLRGAARPVALAREPELTPTPPGDHRAEWRAVALIAAAATLTATFIEAPVATADGAIVRMAGLFLWALVGWAVVVIGASPLALALSLGGAAVTLAAHAQIDVTPTWAATAPIFMVLFAAAAAPTGAVAPAAARPAAVRMIPGAAVLAVASLVVVFAALPALRWQGHLIAASRSANAIARVNTLYAEARRAASDAERARLQMEFLSTLSAALDRRVEPTGASVDRAILELELLSASAAAERLQQAAAVYPADWRSRREAARATLRLAAAYRHAGRPADMLRELDRAIGLGGGPPPESADAPDPRTAPELVWLSLVYRTHVELTGNREPLRLAFRALEAATRRDPYNADHAARLFDLSRELNDEETARIWGRRALELDALTRLDPEGRALPQSKREAIRALVGEP